MQALVTQPGTAGTAHIADVAEPTAADDAVLLRVVEVGVCGTDREIIDGHFGVAPPGRDTLVLGHELLGRVERDGHGFSRGDLVAATVRRSCGHCAACAAGSPDSCLTGDYTERGITALDGFASELVAESAEHLVPVPARLQSIGVLSEPTSVGARAVRHARTVGDRQVWRPSRALVLGNGAIGMLSAVQLRLEGLEVWVTGPGAAARRAPARRRRRAGHGRRRRGARSARGDPGRLRHRRQHGRRASRSGARSGQPVISLGTSGTAYVTSSRPARDATGTVAGFADAAGGFLPLAATLNCTLAVDRFAALLHLDREDVAPAGEVVVLPFLDGERTPNLPRASGLVLGLRHGTAPGAILQAAYDGAAVSLLGAFAAIAAAGGHVDDDAPLVVVGGGAQGAAWRRTLARLSGRAIAVPDATELVALGAAAQAAAVLHGRDPAAVARSWDLGGAVVEPAGEADRARVEQIQAALAAAAPLLGGA